MKMKQLIRIAALLLSALTLNQAMAHGASAPQHGGIVQMTNNVNFDLVLESEGATIYLIGHDGPVESKDIADKLTVLQGSKKSEVDVKAAGGNKLRATGIKLGKGDKIVAVLNNVEGKTATVRFTVK